MPATKLKTKRRFFRVCLRCLRWCRICLVFLTLFVVLAVLYLTEAGLPDFLKRPLLANLKSRGIELQFSRVRWHWFDGIVAEDVQAGSKLQEMQGLQLFFKEAGLGLNYSALAHGQIKIDAVTLRGGNLVWPLTETNEPAAALSLTNFQAALQFLPADEWEVSQFSTDFAGARLNVSGDIRHASAIRQWNILQKKHGTATVLFNTRLRHFARILEQIHFQTQPSLNVTIHGDAADPGSFGGIILLKAPAAETPWGNLSDGDLILRLRPNAEPGGPSRVELQLNASQIITSWASARPFRLNVNAVGDDHLTNLIRVDLQAASDSIFTPWAQTANASLNAHWSHSLTNFLPAEGEVQLEVTNASTRWATATKARVNVGFNSEITNLAPADESWGWWRHLQPYFLGWNCRVEHLQSQQFESQALACGGEWRAPELVITNLHTEMYRGQVDAHGHLDVATRAATVALTSDFDALKIYSALPPLAQNWLDRQQIAYENPPQFHGNANVILPEWTNHHPDWHGEVLPTLGIAGDFKVGTASYRQVPINSAQSHLNLSNLVWSLPDLVVTRPEGKVELAFISHEQSGNFHIGIHSSVDVAIARNFLEPKAQAAFDRFQASEAPQVDAELWGRWHDHDRTGFKGTVTLSNFSYKAEHATFFHGDLAYTNKILLLTRPRLERTNQFMIADAVALDFNTMKGYLTNGQGVFDAMVICRAIGPRTAKVVEPYHFAEAPTAEAYGVIPLSQDISVADLHFKVNGGPFEWLKLRSPHITGLVDWVGQSLTLRDVTADFYQGLVTGDAQFHFHEANGAELAFRVAASAVNLQALMRGVSTNATHLEGTLGGNWQITQADAGDLASWFGNGRLEIHDGLIWDIPIFGILSPVLDSISPGLGKTRASEGSASFVITNGVARTEDLKVHSPAIDLLYRGTIDYQLRVDAKVEAEFGRELPLFGALVSTVLMPVGKLFETRVTGTLHDPKREPVLWVTRLISPLIHPWRLLMHLAPGETPASTNAPPKIVPPSP